MVMGNSCVVAPSVRVSHHADDLVQDLRQAYDRMACASGDVDVGNAYAAMCFREEALYLYLQMLETQALIPPSVIRRF